MPGIIGRDQPSLSWASLRKPRVLAAVSVLVSSALAGYLVLHNLHSVVLPFYVYPFFPFIVAASGALLLPLLMYVSYEVEFQDLNPIYPPHYFAIARRCYKALADNNLKVAAKDI